MQSLELEETPLIQAPVQTGSENREENPAEEEVYGPNMINFMLTIAAIMGSLILQTILLSEGKYFKTKPEDAGTTLSIGLIIQLATYLALSKSYIEISRRYGVRNLTRYGAIIYMVGCLCSVSEAPVLSNFFVCQFLFGNALTALLNVPWKSADSSDPTKTKASVDLAFLLFIMTTSVPSSMGLFTFFGSWASSQICVSALLVLGLIMNSFYMKDINQRRYSTRTDNEAKELVKTHKWLLMLIALRGALTIFYGGIATFTTLHYYSFLITTDNKNPNLAVRVWSQMTFMLPIICSRIYERFLNKDNENLTINLSVFACVSSAIFWIVIPIAGYESGSISNLAIIVSGVGASGIFMISDNIHRRFFTETEQKIVREYLRKVHLVPLMIVVLTCGLMYDYWRKEAAFYLIGLILVLCGLIAKKTSTLLSIPRKVRCFSRDLALSEESVC